jgi:hypothetical protein
MHGVSNIKFSNAQQAKVAYNNKKIQIKSRLTRTINCVLYVHCTEFY